MGPRLNKIVERYALFIIRHHRLILIVTLLLTALSGLSASRFVLRTDFAELLPQDEPSVRDLERAKQRKGGLSSMHVVVTGEDVSANRRLTEDLAARFQKLPKDVFVFLRYNINDERAFVEKHQHLFMDLVDLKTIQRRLRKKLDYERVKNNPVLDMDFDGEPLEPVELELSDIKHKYEGKASAYSQFIDGYFTGEDGHLFAIMLFPPETSTGVDFGRRMLREVKQAAAEVCSGGQVSSQADLDRLIEQHCRLRYHPTIRVGFAGGIVTAVEEQEALVADLVLVTCLCLLLVGLVVLAYFRLWRSLPVIGIPLVMGTLWTFGISIFIVGSLNTCTAFLAAIIVGNGINFGIIQFARFLEERRAGRALPVALAQALQYTTKATAVAALAASIAYGSLIVTKFRGFNGFGYMGGLGMILCWLSSFVVQPAFVTFFERLRPLRICERRRSRLGTWMIERYTLLLERFRGLWHGLAWMSLALCVAAAIPYLRDPFEYDFRALRNRAARESGSGALNERVDRIFPMRLDPLLILAEREEQVPWIVSALERSNGAGPHAGVFQAIQSVDSFLPNQQPQKIEVLLKIRRLLRDSTLSWLSPEQRPEVERYRPPKELRPLTRGDLPEGITRMFTERDGRMGLPIALYPDVRRNPWDGRLLLQIADASRAIALPDGGTVSSTGVAVVFADMLRAIERDGPRAVAVSLAGVVLLVILAFRKLRSILPILAALLFGVAWTVGPAALIGLKLNFLNFIALPITFGIGIDYSVNIFSRLQSEGRGSLRRVLANTGGAVLLCSVTTLIGYGSLLIADSRALVSFGVLSILGELACLAGATFLVPVLILVTEGKKKVAARAVPGAVPSGTGRLARLSLPEPK